MEKTARSSAVIQLALLILLAVSASGCEAIGTIFKAGLWTGVIVVVLAVVVIGFLVSKLRR